MYRNIAISRMLVGVRDYSVHFSLRDRVNCALVLRGDHRRRTRWLLA